MSPSDHDEELSSDSIENTDQDDETSEESSDSSEEDSSEEEEDIDVWARIQNQAIERHQQEHEVLVQKYIQDGESDEIAEVKANNALLPTYRKELREILFDELKWLHFLKRDPTFKKIVASRKNLMDAKDYSWEEATQSAIHQRKYLLNKQFSKEKVPKKSENQSERFHPYARNLSGFY